MKYVLPLLCGIGFCWIGIDVAMSGVWSQYGDDFTLPPVAGWICFGWGAVVVGWAVRRIWQEHFCVSQRHNQ